MANGIDISAANAVLKRVYGNKKAVVQFESAAPYVKGRKKTPRKFGAGLYEGIQYSDIESIGIRNSGPGSPDNEDLPKPSSPVWDQPNFDTARTYARITISGKAQSRGFSGDMLQSFMGDIADLNASVARAYWRDCEFRAFNTSTAVGSKSGCRGILAAGTYATGTPATFTLDVSTATGRRYRALQGIRQGMNLDLYNENGGAWNKVAEIAVSSVDELAGTFEGTIDNTIDTAAIGGDFYLFRNGDFNRDIIGLGDIIDDGTYTATYGGLPTAGLWKGIVLANGGTLRSFSPLLMNQAQLRLEKRNDGDEQMEGWMSYGMKQELLGFYQRTIISTKQMGLDPFKVNVGGNVEQWGPNFDIKTSPRMASHEIFLVLPKAVDFLEQEPFGPVSLGQGKNGADRFFQRVIGKDNWEAVLVHDFQQRTLERNKFVKISDLNQNGY